LENQTTITGAPKKSGRGGARPGSGRPRLRVNDDGQPLETGNIYEALAKEKMRHEALKADRAEIENRLRAGELLERHDVEQAAMRMHAAIAQHLRSLPDALERRLGLSPAVVEDLEQAMDAATVELSERIADVLKG
jgi:phage terminase Nu1 subunit (DNA packaging protein)